MTTNKGVIVEAAAAKINLALHVTGQRADGYHLLDSLVIFADVGDLITVAPAPDLTLTIDGPFAAGLKADNSNLVLQAARLFGVSKGAAITLTKNLPVASGIGGGSADAAAALLALNTLWKTPLPDWDAIMGLGADVGVCLSRDLTRMRGIGEDLDLIGPAPPLHLLLVNPGIAVPTPQVFAGLANKNSSPLPDTMPEPWGTSEWITWLTEQRNDLEIPATHAAPEIATVLETLRNTTGHSLVRMSGSGATCFAIYADADTRDRATTAIRTAHPDWWVAPAMSVT